LLYQPALNLDDEEPVQQPQPHPLFWQQVADEKRWPDNEMVVAQRAVRVSAE
jgi:hypothetical protein